MTPISPAAHRRRLWATGLLAGLLVACAGNTGSSTAWRNAAGPVTLTGLPRTVEEAAPTAAGDYLAGNFALDRGDVRSAADYLGRALDRNPDNLDLLQQVFLLTLASGNERAALDQALRLVKADAPSEEAQLMLALDEAQGGRFDAAARRLGAIDRGGIAGVVVPVLDAWAAFGKGDVGAALGTLAGAADAESMGTLHAYHRAMMLHLDGRTREAVDVMRAAMPDDGRAPLRMVRALGGMLHGAGAADEARRLYGRQIELGGDDVVLEGDAAALARGEAPPAPFEDAAGGMADALLGIAEALQQQGGGSRAIAYARLAEFVRPGYPEAALLIGDIFADRENHEEAVQAYRTVGDGPSAYAWEARLRTARALHAMERKDDAYRLLREMADERPERTDALVELGNLLRRDESYEPAEVAYSRAIERIGDPERPDWPLLYSRGITYERTDRWPEAEADFLRALELEPEQPFVLNYLGYSWIEKGMHLDRAQDMIRRAVELRPNDGFIVDSLGWVY
ncbi:MAG TPA: tetratricopeptide repeat protein, partial [Geminicoccaceae bacterium]|nr:tetratricopeptide repeat protein [Geminicoccaceae bacterium]